MVKRVTTRDIRSMKARREPIPMITAYDFTSAMLADRAGVPIVLVGDSLGQVMLGYDSTIPVSLDDMVGATAAVARGAPRALIIADMPFMTYQESPEQAMRSAARLMQEGGAQAVKLEGGTPVMAAVRRLCDVGIPVMGHLGLTPQSLNQIGGYRVQGKDERSAARIFDEAIALEDAGAFAIVLELVPTELAGVVTARLSIPTIGIGAGPDCDGQVQVWHDLLGLNPDFKPRHARRFADLAPLIQEAVQRYVSEVKDRKFPTEAETFHAPAPYVAPAPHAAIPTSVDVNPGDPISFDSNGRRHLIQVSPASWTPQRIRSLRESLRLTQTEMSVRVGVAKNNLSAWERGRKHPSLRHQAVLDSLTRESGI